MKTWFLAEIEGDDDTHAAPRNGTYTYCDRPVSFPKGGADRPTCPGCRTEVDTLDPEDAP